MAAFPTATASIVLVLLVPLHADAQYRTTDLTPPNLPAGVGAHIQGVDDAGAHAIGSLMQGTATFRGAVLWDLNAGAHTLLNPAGHRTSLGWGVHGGQQIGWAQQSTTNQIHAALWNGSAGSFVDINPEGAHLSSAHDTNGLYHVGSASFEGAFNRAILWEQRGGAHFWRDMTPPGTEEGAIVAIDGSRQIGGAGAGGIGHAFLWELTPESAIDLHPGGNPLYVHSEGAEIRGDQQVGSAGTGLFQTYHAILWRGSAASAVDLNPEHLGFAYSLAHDTNGRQQVGLATVNPGNPFDPNQFAHAMLWSGTAASALDLHQFLPPGEFTRSFAHAIDDAGSVYGTAYDTAGVPHAIQWTVVPEPSSIAVLALGVTRVLGRLRRRERGRRSLAV
jgi:hypothetical protein